MPSWLSAIANTSTLGKITLSLLQLILLTLAIIQLDIEKDLNLPVLMPFVVVLFLVHALSPIKYRLHVFLLGTVAAVFYLFRWIDASLILILSLGLFAICHLPVRINIRKLILVCCGVLLALTRTPYSPIPMPSLVVSTVGSLFMFRAIIYMYELKFEKEQLSWVKRLSYFMLFPNLCFPIYPIVDYKVFKKTYYDSEEGVIYQRGINLMVRGIVQLLLYRILYLYVLPPVNSVTNMWEFLHYAIISYLLVLRLAGLLNFSVGLLRMFGFNLPDIFNHFLFATGFNDYWRRVNIYWKDFLLKVIYYPAYFRFKKMKGSTPIILATAVTFVMNWFFHAYQWFWVLGGFLIKATDILFWSIFGVLVLIAMIRQTSQPKGKKEPTGWNGSFRTVLNIFATFSTITVLWSLWMSPTFKDWFNLLKAAVNTDVKGVALLLLIIAAILGIGTFIYYHLNHTWKDKIPAYSRIAIPTNLAVLGLLGLSTTSFVLNQLPEDSRSKYTMFIENDLNEEDEDAQFEGYYDEILQSNNLSSQLWSKDRNKDNVDWEIMGETAIAQELDNMLIDGMKPSESIVFKKEQLTSNQWGMRDKNYELLPSEGVTRFVLLGGSVEMGSGVGDGQTFEQLSEDQLNQQGLNVEILNCSFASRHVAQHVYSLENEVLQFKPQYAIYVAHYFEYKKAYKNIERMLEHGISSTPYPFINEIMKEAQEKGKKMKEGEKNKRGKELVEWGYQQFAEIAKKNGVEPVWVYVPAVHERGNQFDDQELEAIARKAGFTCISLRNAYQGYAAEELYLAEWDNHPNKLGHSLLSQALTPALRDLIQQAK